MTITTTQQDAELSHLAARLMNRLRFARLYGDYVTIDPMPPIYDPLKIEYDTGIKRIVIPQFDCYHCGRPAQVQVTWTDFDSGDEAVNIHAVCVYQSIILAVEVRASKAYPMIQSLATGRFFQ